MSKILELAQAKRNAQEQKEQREQTKKLEEQIKLLRKIDETIREKFPDLKPSRA